LPASEIIIPPDQKYENRKTKLEKRMPKSWLRAFRDA
jgi:hypothetical protein